MTREQRAAITARLREEMQAAGWSATGRSGMTDAEIADARESRTDPDPWAEEE
jgi:hypothetical protein